MLGSLYYTFCNDIVKLNPAITKLKLYRKINVKLAIKFIDKIDSKKLYLLRCCIGSKEIKALSNIKKFKTDNNCADSDDGVKSVVNILNINKSLTHLAIGQNFMKSKHIVTIIKSLATNSTIKTFLCCCELLGFGRNNLYSKNSAREILKSLEETCTDVLSENYTLQKFNIVIKYDAVFVEYINLKTITDRNIELAKSTRFIKTKVAPLCD